MKTIKCIILAVFAVACEDSTYHRGYQVDYYPTGNTHRYFQLNKNGQKEGIYFCYYDTGRIKKVGEVANDSILINEELSFGKTGEIEEYSFYNIIGEKRFHRIYDETGKTIQEQGDFFTYTDIKSVDIRRNDSLNVTCYLATPPGVSTSVYLLDNNKRVRRFKTLNTKFAHQFTKLMKNKGSYIMFIEAEFVDTIGGKMVSRRDSISVTVQ